MEGFESLVGINLWTALFTCINMVLTFLFLKKFLFKPVQKMIRSRQDEVKKLYDDAEQAKAEAIEMKENYARSIANAREEAQQIISDATQNAQTRSDVIVSEAKQEAAHLLEKAEAEIQREKKKAINEAKDEISDLALSIASKVVENDLDKERHEQLILKLLDEAGDVQWKA